MEQLNNLQKTRIGTIFTIFYYNSYFKNVIPTSQYDSTTVNPKDAYVTSNTVAPP